jgi:hypothetical protein
MRMFMLEGLCLLDPVHPLRPFVLAGLMLKVSLAVNSSVVNVSSLVVMVPPFCQFAAYRVEYGQ